tara:strand:+ start:317 stop:928 length:612 start_codon:yes stop_codon:yes gene_type:complete
MVLSHALVGAIAGSGAEADTGSWHAIASTTLGSDTASVTFTSAGSSTAWSEFQDLVLLVAARGTNTGAGIGVTTEINDDSGNYYYWQNINSNGSSAGAAKTGPVGYFRPCHIPGSDRTANFFGAAVVHFWDVNATNKHKMILSLDGFEAAHASDDNSVVLRGSRWREAGTAAPDAMTKFVMNPDGNFLAGSQFDLYGVRTATG